MFSPFNWRELALIIDQIRSDMDGLFVERVVVPERPLFPDQYLKGEWAIRLSGRKLERVLIFSIRPRRPYLAWLGGRGPTASLKATHSAFELSLGKYLKGAKFLGVEALPQDRIVILWFSVEAKPQSKLGLVLILIPATPEAFLISADRSSTPLDESSENSKQWPILTRSRTSRESKSVEFYQPSKNSQAPSDLKIRAELLNPDRPFFQRLTQILSQALSHEAFLIRQQNAEKSLRQLTKQAQDRLRQSKTVLQEAEREKDWQKWADALKAGMGSSPQIQNGHYEVKDYITEEITLILADPKLTLQQQVEKYYHFGRRKLRRIQEATSRIKGLNETLETFQKALETPLSPPENILPEHWKALETLEKISGVQSPFQSSNAPTIGQGKGGKSSKKSSQFTWLGKVFTSKDGTAFCVGRNKDENLELTFKHARGNDIWMHVRGKPGAHCIVPLSSGKSASLETLLDAATLTIFYSGGQNWGKTEVDYTYKKYVKRIKDSSEASYTNNKTLLVESDAARLKRLLAQNER